MPTAHQRPWHKGSLFGPGPRRPLDRERRARWTYLVHAYTRAGRVSPKGEWVAKELLDHLSRDGRCDPSYARLAADADTAESTVGEAIKRLAGVGLLHWQRRLDRVGDKVVQTSNAYELIIPGDQEPHPVRRATSLKKMESGFTPASGVATIPGTLPAPLAGFEVRFAAKLEEERRVRRGRVAAIGRR